MVNDKLIGTFLAKSNGELGGRSADSLDHGQGVRFRKI